MQRLSTADVAPHAQYDFWHNIVETSFAHCDGIAPNRRAFHAEIEIASCGDSELTALTSDAVRYVRDARHVRRSGTDAFFVSVMLEGGGYFRQNDRAVHHGAGTVLIYDSARPYQYDYPGAYRTALLRVPRPMMDARMLGVRDLGGTLLGADRPQAALIRGLITNLMDTARDSDLPEQFIAPTLDLIAGAFGQGAGCSEAAGRNPALNRIKRFMVENMGNEDLGVADIVATQNISARSLGRAFAAEGTTPMSWLRDRRLAEAHAMLSEGRARSVTEAAYDCGFRDLSYFGRAFKKAYGKTPRQAFVVRH
ncbi:helix-turn-helix domain-containing protein [Pseudooceanicola nanhaiensis]|uniref:helix-turn-helix domain-containing protein n=1 Tax=Pseudooceanicola nanhaiensis TaxID=375761 RepID=UPI001CD20A99|nr:helix-turn-helix domain-containing protein [Pseudooceanicola nanhaiensis]MCA0921445.1 helix-turn-helix domain-containing protein [Pseudooceanicola nanhaiensis]